MLMQRVKPLSRILAEGSDEKHGLKRSLGPWALTAMGIGAIIGTGIFVLTGVASATRAGPSLTLSFVVAGIVSALAALCYAEVSSKIPISGSAYTYTYATMGEFLAWIVGWGLVLEYALGASTVSVGWSGYFTFILHTLFNCEHSRRSGSTAIGTADSRASRTLPAAGIIFSDHRAARARNEGIRLGQRRHRRDQSCRRALLHRDRPRPHQSGELSPSARTARPVLGGYFPFGWAGMLGGAAFIFFAYIGFDAVSTTAEEARNPGKGSAVRHHHEPGDLHDSLHHRRCDSQRHGAVLHAQRRTSRSRLRSTSVGLAWAGVIISFGAIAGLTTVLLVMMYGQTPNLLRDVARRTDSAARSSSCIRRGARHGSSQILFGVLIAAAGALVPDQHPGIAHEHGNALGVRARLDCRPDTAQAPSRDCRAQFTFRSARIIIPGALGSYRTRF